MNHFQAAANQCALWPEKNKLKTERSKHTMTSAERIEEKREKIKKLKEKIAAEQAKINKLSREIEELESLEVKGLIKELNLPLEDIKELIREISSKTRST